MKENTPSLSFPPNTFSKGENSIILQSTDLNYLIIQVALKENAGGVTIFLPYN